jgi:phosphoribosylformylglycinamidine (FGAM) synthase-like amidotransferase family enzyme
MKLQRVVQGLDNINALLEDGWKVEKLMPHSERYENFIMGRRESDRVEFWLIAVMCQYKEELNDDHAE